MKQFFDSISLASGILASRTALFSAAAAILLIGCAGAPDELANDATTRTAQLRPRTDTVGYMHEVKKAELRGCFDGGQGEGAEAGDNRVEVELQLPSSGVPSKVRVVNKDAVSPAVGKCLEDIIAKFEYGKSDHGATFYQVFVFDHDSQKVAFEKPVNAYQRWGLTREEIRDVFAEHEEEINQCYALATDAPKGRVVLSMSIRAAGPPEQVALKSSTLENQAADMCLVETVLEMEFPEPRGQGLTVREVPLHFSSDGGWINPDRK